MPTAQDFEDALQEILHVAQNKGEDHVVVTSGDLHRRVGGYPGRNHRMPVCCGVLRRMMQRGDEILSEPPSGQGATLTIRYNLSRNDRV
jgi:hypothetical protein